MKLAFICAALLGAVWLATKSNLPPCNAVPLFYTGQCLIRQSPVHAVSGIGAIISAAIGLIDALVPRRNR
jgi:hypothetical protein